VQYQAGMLGVARTQASASMMQAQNAAARNGIMAGAQAFTEKSAEVDRLFGQLTTEQAIMNWPMAIDAIEKLMEMEVVTKAQGEMFKNALPADRLVMLEEMTAAATAVREATRSAGAFDWETGFPMIR